MACMSCAERARLLRQGVQNIRQQQPIRPIVQQFGQTIRRDVQTILRPVNARLGPFRPR